MCPGDYQACKLGNGVNLLIHSKPPTFLNVYDEYEEERGI